MPGSSQVHLRLPEYLFSKCFCAPLWPAMAYSTEVSGLAGKVVYRADTVALLHWCRPESGLADTSS